MSQAYPTKDEAETLATLIGKASEFKVLRLVLGEGLQIDFAPVAFSQAPTEFDQPDPNQQAMLWRQRVEQAIAESAAMPEGQPQEVVPHPEDPTHPANPPDNDQLFTPDLPRSAT